MTRGRVAAAVGAILAIAVAAFLLLAAGDSQARSSLDGFLVNWSGEDYEVASAATDDPKAAAKEMEANRVGLDGASLSAEVTEFSEEDGTATATVDVAWDVPAIGEYAYPTEVELKDAGDDEWLVTWSEAAIHPDLADGERLGTESANPRRAPIVDRNGREIMSERPVVDVGIIPGDARDVDVAIDAIVASTEADEKALRKAVRAAGPEGFAVAITLRQEDYLKVEDELRPVDGVAFVGREQALAPTRDFAAALLGDVGPVTAEQLEELGPDYGVGDQVGQSGLSAAYEERLAGTPTRRIVIRDAEGVPVETLEKFPGEPGKPLRLTLDAEVQDAAEAALNGEKGKVSLVAVQPSSGDVLAVANRPSDDTFNRGFEGQYPPGSTFKVVSTAALLESGLRTDEIVDCPPTATVGGLQFRNFEGSAAGAVPFTQDFAESCNTAFVSLSSRLEPDDYPATAEAFGLGREYDSAVPMYAGSVPAPKDAAEQAAATIGQGRNLASPLAMAGVAATVADGRWRQPRLLADDPREAGEQLPDEVVGELRELMRLVVTSGTGTALSGLPGSPAGKSGTAEFGSGDPPPTHGWFIAFRGDLAVAVIVEGAASGGEFAAPIVNEMLERLPAR